MAVIVNDGTERHPRRGKARVLLLLQHERQCQHCSLKQCSGFRFASLKRRTTLAAAPHEDLLPRRPKLTPQRFLSSS